MVSRNKAELEEARAELSLDPVTRELETERASIDDSAAAFLGPVLPEDLGPLLETNVVERENPLWIEGLTKLFDALTLAGSGFRRPWMLATFRSGRRSGSKSPSRTPASEPVSLLTTSKIRSPTPKTR